jgi:hypothetical protein
MKFSERPQSKLNTNDTSLMKLMILMIISIMCIAQVAFADPKSNIKSDSIGQLSDKHDYTREAYQADLDLLVPLASALFDQCDCGKDMVACRQSDSIMRALRNSAVSISESGIDQAENLQLYINSIDEHWKSNNRSDAYVSIQ